MLATGSTGGARAAAWECQASAVVRASCRARMLAGARGEALEIGRMTGKTHTSVRFRFALAPPLPLTSMRRPPATVAHTTSLHHGVAPPRPSAGANRHLCAPRATPPDRGSTPSARPDADSSLGMKAAWLGAEALGDVVGALSNKDGASSPPPESSSSSTEPLSRDSAVASIRSDYDLVYFVSGKGDLAAYDDDCEFADPFASFRGKSRFLKNVANLGGLLQDVKLDLKSFDATDDALVTSWSFSGIFTVFPWRPRLAAAGRTTHTFNPKTGRVARHYEDWASSPAEVLKGLLKPSSRVPTSRWDVWAESLYRGEWAAAYRAAAPPLAVGAAVNAVIARVFSGGSPPGLGEYVLWVGVAAAVVAAVQEVLPRAK